jgi:hypothetical protein
MIANTDQIAMFVAGIARDIKDPVLLDNVLNRVKGKIEKAINSAQSIRKGRQIFCDTLVEKMGIDPNSIENYESAYIEYKQGNAEWEPWMQDAQALEAKNIYVFAFILDMQRMMEEMEDVAELEEVPFSTEFGGLAVIYLAHNDGKGILELMARSQYDLGCIKRLFGETLLKYLPNVREALLADEYFMQNLERVFAECLDNRQLDLAKRIFVFIGDKSPRIIEMAKQSNWAVFAVLAD